VGNKQGRTVIVILILIVLVLCAFLVFVNPIIHKEADNNNLPTAFSPTQSQTTPTPSCIDSNEQCKSKPNGAPCSTGVWCDEEGKVCGGNSCVGIGLGECINDTCTPENP
jgi:hypothetical protein